MHKTSRKPQVWELDTHVAWQFIQLANGHFRGGSDLPLRLGWDGETAWVFSSLHPPQALHIYPDGRWQSDIAISPEARDFLDLYLPLATLPATKRYVIGHLGQSLDGRIAGTDGNSRYITGSENLDHLHRLRALCDAVVVGAKTVRQDDPRLTVRRVSGAHPTRVVIDPERRLEWAYQVFRDDQTKTVILKAKDRPSSAPMSSPSANIDVVAAPRLGTGLDLQAALDRLAERGLNRIFVEGGGITVSRFLDQGCLDRLQIAVAPMILGAGRPGIQMTTIPTIDQALRPVIRRYIQGDDVLFDCDLKPRND